MSFPPATIAADKANNTAIPNDHPAHHNSLATAINDTVSEVQDWTVDRDANGLRLDNLGKLNLGTDTNDPLVQLIDMGGSATFVGGEHVTLHEYGSYEAEFNTTNGGSFVGVHITPQITGNATVTEIVGIQSQVSSIASVTSQIHAVEALVNFGTIGQTAVLSRSLWAQTVAALGTITDAHGVDVTGGSGSGTITTMYGVRIGRTSGSLALVGTTKYGVYVNQGSVRNYFGGDTQFGGGTNGTWDSYVARATSAGFEVAGVSAVTGSTGQFLVGVTSHSGSLNPEISSEKAYTEATTASRTGIVLSGTKTFSTNAGSGFYGVYTNPVVSTNQNMSDVASFYGITTVARHTSATPTITAVYGGYFKASVGQAVTGTTVRGVYAEVQAAIGTVTTGVGVDIATSNSLGTLTTAIGLRITTMAGTTQWGMQVGDYNSYHEGDLRVGAVSGGSTAAPGGKLDVIQETIGSDVARFSSVAGTDDPVERMVQASTTTTSNSVTTLHSITLPSDTTSVIHAYVVARRTGGSSGAAQDGAGYYIIGTFKNTAGTVAQIGSTVDVAAAGTQESQSGWACVFDVTGATARIRVTGATNNNVTWHSTSHIFQVST